MTDGDIVLSVDLNADSAIATSANLKDDIKKIFSKAGNNTTTAFKNLQVQMDNAVVRADRLVNQLTELRNTTFVTPEYAKLEKQLELLDNKYTKLSEQRRKLEAGGKIGTNKYKELEVQLQSIYNEAERLRGVQSQMEQDGTAFIYGDETDKYSELTQMLNQVNNQMVILKQRAIEFGSEGSNSADKTGRSFSLLSSIAESLSSSLKNVATYAKRVSSSAISSGIKKLRTSFSNLGKSSDNTSKSLQRGAKVLFKYIFGVRSFFFLYRKIRKSITEGFQNLAQVHEPFNESMSQIMTSLNLLKNTFAAAFAPIVEVVAPALVTFINLIAKAVASVGQFIAALTGKEYIQAGSAYIDYAQSVDKSTASSKSNTKATKEQNKAAKDLKKTLAGFDDVQILHEDKDTSTTEDTPVTPNYSFTPSSIGDAVKDFAAKFKAAIGNSDFTEIGRILGEKLKSALESIPWDTIKTVLNRIAKSIATFLNGFLETPGLFATIGRTIATALNTAFEAVGTFVRTFHWESLGNAIRDLIINLLNNIDWTTIRGTLTGLTRGLGQTLQTALNNPTIWTLAFTTIANGFNVLIASIRSFLNEVRWGDLGKNIATGLNNGINAIDWRGLARTLLTLINSAFTLFYNFVTTLDFHQFGDYVGSTLSEAINGIDWTTGGASIAVAFSGLYQAVNGFVESTDWGAVGASIIDAIAGFFDNLDWGAISTFASNKIIAFFNLLGGAFAEVNWEELPSKITEAIKSFLSGFDWEGVATATGSLIGNAFKAVTKLGSVLWNNMKEVGKNIIDGGLEGILNVISEIGLWVLQHVVAPFINGFKEAFGIQSPSKKMMPIGGYIIGGMLQGIITALVGIGTWIKQNVVDPIVSGVKRMFGLDGETPALFSIGKNLIESFKNGIKNIIDQVSTWAKTIFIDPFINKVKELFGLKGEQNQSALTSVATDLIAGFKTGIKNVFSEVGKWAKTIFIDPFVNAVKELFGLKGEQNQSSLTSVATDLITGFKTGIKNVFNKASKWVQEIIIDPFMNAINSLFGLDGEESLLFEVGKNLIEGLKDGILNMMGGIGDWIKEKVTDPIKGFFEFEWLIGSPSKVFEGYGQYLMEGLENGVEDNVDLPKNALASANTLMQNVFSGITQLIAWAGIGTTIMKLGLLAGIALQTPSLILAMTNLESDMRGEFTGHDAEWESIGSGIGTHIYNGLSSCWDWLTAYATSLGNFLYYAINNQDWASIGRNVCNGIYDGIMWGWEWLTTTAYNLALQMYYNACYALGIASPSKEFAWIGEMITQGLGNGISDNTDNAVDAVTDLTSAITDEAEKTNPAITLSTSVDNWINSLDFILTKFSDSVISKFDSMITTLERLATLSSFSIPDIADGKVVPSSSRTSGVVGSNMSQLVDNINSLLNERISPDELRSILVDVISNYADVSFYIGDEQIARHANAGNLRLQRRYSTI